MTLSPRLAILDTELDALARGHAARRPERAVAAHELGAAAGLAPGNSERVALKLLVQPGSEKRVADWIAGEGGRIISEGGVVLVAELPVGSLAALEGLEGVRRAAAPKVLFPQLDPSPGDGAAGLGAAPARQALTGQGVVIGVVDTGIDWTHPDFRNEDGRSRLEALLHASRSGSTDVSRYETYTRAALNRALARPPGRGPKGGLPPRDPNGHGTHCASIAAGNGRASGGRYRGVAPAATLIAAQSEPLFDDHTIWAIRQIFARAGRRPAVISLSLGHHQGAHDGTALLENVIAEESGPGRIVVVAAGNDGASGIHWQGDLAAGQALAIPFRVADQVWQFVEVWVPRGDEVEIAVLAPDGEQVPLGIPSSTGFGFCTADWQQDPVNRDNHLRLFVEGGELGSQWTIVLRAGVVRHGEVHAWSGTLDPRSARDLFPGPAAPLFSVSIPATEERAIAVASWISRPTYQGKDGLVAPAGLIAGALSPFSSHGPTRHGLQKPDIAAPGQFVTAALAAGSDKAEDRFRALQSPDGPYVTLAGTSMAAPLVAGVIALMLEKEPRLTPEAIQQRLRATARRDENTGRVWGPGWGWGKIDVEALLSYEG